MTRFLLILLFFIFFIKEAYTLLPYSEVEYKLFPFSEELITKQTYIHYGCIYTMWCILLYILSQVWTECKDIISLFLVFQFLELIEYFITYNEPWLGGMSVFIVKSITCFFALIYKIWKI